MNISPSKIVHIVLSSALLLNAQAQASRFIDQQAETTQQREARLKIEAQKRQEAYDFLKLLARDAISNSANTITNHVLNIHGIGINQIHVSAFDNREYYTLFDRTTLNSAAAFAQLVNSLLATNATVDYNSARTPGRIIITLKSNTELGHIISEDDYKYSRHMINTQHSGDPRLTGTPGKTLSY